MTEMEYPLFENDAIFEEHYERMGVVFRTPAGTETATAATVDAEDATGIYHKHEEIFMNIKASDIDFHLTCKILNKVYLGTSRFKDPNLKYVSLLINAKLYFLPQHRRILLTDYIVLQLCKLKEQGQVKRLGRKLCERVAREVLCQVYGEKILNLLNS